MLIRRTLQAALVGVLLSSTAAAQNVSLTGRVIDPQGGIVVNASVTLTGAGVRQVTVRTNAEGSFTFASLTPCHYVLQIESPGFMPWMQDVTVGTVP